MDVSIGTSQTTVAVTSTATVSQQNLYLTKFVSQPLAASGTLSTTANGYTLSFAAKEANANANFPVTTSGTAYVCMYVWRPSTGAIVGMVLNGASAGTVSEASIVENALSYTFTGAAIAYQAGDVLVFEVIAQVTQASATAYTNNFYYDGTTEASGTNCASFLSCPDTLRFGTFIYFHDLTSSVTGTLPTTQQGSYAAPLVTVDAYTVNRSMDTTIGTAQTSKAGAISLSNKTIYLTKFVSQPLNQTSVAANTWNYSFAAAETSTGCNFPVPGTSAVNVTVYVWRPSTGAKVGNIMDGTSSGTQYSEPGAGAIQSVYGSFTGSAVTCQVGDVIVMEIYFAMTTPASGTVTFYYDGTTETPNNGTTVTNHASYIQTPEILAFGVLTRLTTQKTLKYAVKARVADVSTVKYALKKRVADVNILKYALKARVKPVRTLKYKLSARLKPVTTLKYALRKRVPTQKTTLYRLLKRIPTLRTVKYALKARIAAQRIAKYKLAARIKPVRTLQYKLLHRQTTQRTTLYKLLKRVPTQRTTLYKLLKRVPTLRTVKYVLNARVQPVRIIKYKVAARVKPVRTLQYKLLKRLPTQRTLQYKLLKRLPTQRTTLYKLAKRITTVRTTKYALKLRIASQRVIKYKLTARIKPQRTVVYQLRKTVLTQRVIKYRLTARLKALKTIIYQLSVTGALQRVQTTRVIKYKLVARLQKRQTLQYRLLHRIAVPPQTLKYSLRKLVQSPRALKYRLAARIKSPRTLRYAVVARLKLSKAVKYSLLRRLTSSRSIKYRLMLKVKAARTLRYKLTARLKTQRVIKYGLVSLLVLRRVQTSITLKYAVRSRFRRGYKPTGTYELAAEKGAGGRPRFSIARLRAKLGIEDGT